MKLKSFCGETSEELALWILPDYFVATETKHGDSFPSAQFVVLSNEISSRRNSSRNKITMKEV